MSNNIPFSFNDVNFQIFSSTVTIAASTQQLLKLTLDSVANANQTKAFPVFYPSNSPEQTP